MIRPLVRATRLGHQVGSPRRSCGGPRRGRARRRPSWPPRPIASRSSAWSRRCRLRPGRSPPLGRRHACPCVPSLISLRCPLGPGRMLVRTATVTGQGTSQVDTSVRGGDFSWPKAGTFVATSGDLRWPQPGTFSWPRTPPTNHGIRPDPADWVGYVFGNHGQSSGLGGLGTFGCEFEATVGIPVGSGDTEPTAERGSVGAPVAPFLAHGHLLPGCPLVGSHGVDRTNRLVRRRCRSPSQRGEGDGVRRGRARGG